MSDLLAQHDLRLVLLALAIGLAGFIAAMRLFVRASEVRGSGLRQAWVTTAAVVAGAAVWSLHYIALLAYRPGTTAHFDAIGLAGSLAVVTVGMAAGFSVALLDRTRACPFVGGALVGFAIAAMHYAGMAGFAMDRGRGLDPFYLTASVARGVVFAVAAMMAARGRFGARGVAFAAWLLAAAMVGVHFTGMAAMHMPAASAAATHGDQGTVALAIATAGLGLLVIAAGGFIHFIDRTTRRETSLKLASMALTDALTGLPNQAAFDQELAARIERTGVDDGLQVMTIKLLHFSDVITRYGRRHSDLAIQALVARMNAAKKPAVFIARTGKAEFSAIGPLMTSTSIRQRVETIATVLAVPLAVDQVEIAPDPRIGVARFPADGVTVADLMRSSRLALVRAKADPLERVCLYEDQPDRAVERRQILADDLRGALELGESELHYQPQVWTADRSVIGQEALLRWRHPRFGLIAPDEFIPLAEASGAIVAIGQWAIREACRTAVTWPEAWTVAVNVSPLQLRQADLPERIEQALRDSGLAPERLEIELTESLLIADRSRALAVLGRIRALGVRLALDDFGTGYSSLDVLRHFAFDKIKLDRSFVAELESNPQSLAILQAMLAMGRSLGIPVLVEGVECERQLAILAGEGCRKVQGYLVGRPVPAAEIDRWGDARVVPLRRAG